MNRFPIRGTLLALGCAALLLATVASAAEKPKKEGKSETIRLFSGKDLEGWEGHENLWSVKDGVIVAKNTEPIKVSTYLLTKRKFSDFRLTAAVKLVQSELHSGVAFWGRNAPEHGDR